MKVDLSFLILKVMFVIFQKHIKEFKQLVLKTKTQFNEEKRKMERIKRSLMNFEIS